MAGITSGIGSLVKRYVLPFFDMNGRQLFVSFPPDGGHPPPPPEPEPDPPPPLGGQSLLPPRGEGDGLGS